MTANLFCLSFCAYTVAYKSVCFSAVCRDSAKDFNYKTKYVILKNFKDLTLYRAVKVVCVDLVAGAHTSHHIPHPPA